MSDHDEWIAIEYTREALADIRQRLRAGADGAGATLDADDCVKVLACLVNPPFPNNRPRDLSAELRDTEIFIDCRLRQRGMPRSQAVGETAALFGVSKGIVNRVLRERAKARSIK